jgi:hypothetical protein
MKESLIHLLSITLLTFGVITYFLGVYHSMNKLNKIEKEALSNINTIIICAYGGSILILVGVFLLFL